MVADGGLPRSRCTLLVGTAGAGKTVLATHLLAAGIREFGQPGVLVTFEETPESVLQNVASFGWGLDEHVAAGQLALVDVSPEPGHDLVEVGEFDLQGLLARIQAAITETGAQRVVLDSVTALLPQFDDERRVRREMTRIIHALNGMGVTSVLTAERDLYQAKGLSLIMSIGTPLT